MKKSSKLRLAALAGIGILLAAAVGLWRSETQPVPEDTPVRQERTAEERARQIADAMSPEDKAGQLLMVGLMGPDLDEEAVRQITACHAGNVILFDRNMVSSRQVQSLTAAIRQRIGQQSGVAPFIAADQEGGQVLRMRDAFPAIPSQAKIGSSGKPEDARRWAETTGKELKRLGITVNFAPVVDLGSAAERSYGTDPDQVAAYALQACLGYGDASIWCALKHFPGIGKVKTDPHLDGDNVTAPEEVLKAQDLKPFEALIRQVDNNAMFIMVSNVTFPALDPERPACISPRIMTDLLRNTCQYTGLIVSDDMEMGAMAKHYDFSAMGVMALQAGADMVLVCHDYGHEREVYDGIVEAYRKDPSFRQLVDKKVLKVVQTKVSMPDYEEKI